MKYFSLVFINFLSSIALAFVSLKDIKDSADEAVSAVYTAESLVELLEELEGSEESRRREYQSMLATANKIREELDDLSYASEDAEEILGPIFNARTLEGNIRRLTARIKKIKSFKTRALKFLSIAGKASNDAVLNNETNKILREIQSEQILARVDSDKMKLHAIKLESSKKVKKKRNIQLLWKAVETDSRKRKIPPAGPILVEKPSGGRNDRYW